MFAFVRGVVLTAVALAAATSSSTERLTATDVDIIATDYAFRVPAALPAGYTRFTLVNRGKVRHEFNVALLKSGATVQQYVDAVKANRSVAPLIDATIGVLFARPGSSSPSALSTNLLPGRTYAVICVVKDSRTARRHYELGMFNAIHVAATGARPTRPMRTDTVYAMDYAYRLPQTFAPGLHRLVFVNMGTQRHEMSIARLRPDVTLEAVRDADRTRAPLEPLIDQPLGVLHARGGMTPLGHLEIDFAPGRTYVLECGFADTDTSPPHYTLGMKAAIRVPEK